MAGDFQAIQKAFAAHLRDPDGSVAPAGIEERRLQIYRRLFFNNIQGFLAQAFPVLRALTPDADWQALVRRFYASHSCSRPQFYQLAQEFVEFLQQDVDAPGPAFRLELAHYEWQELVIAIDPSPLPDYQPCDGIALDQRPVFSPWLAQLSYDWPVHQIGPAYQPDVAPEQATCLLVFRKLDDEVAFLQLNLLTARLLELLRSSSMNLGEGLEKLAAEAQMAVEQLAPFGQDLIQQLLQRGAILGRV